MKVPHYNTFAGQDRDRVQALSDGVFAIALTLLAIEIRLPDVPIDSNAEFFRSVGQLLPLLTAYALSFTMLGTFWLAQHTLIGLTERIDRTASWLHLAFLSAVGLLPFTTSVLGEHNRLSGAVALYWVNLALLGLWLALAARHALRGHEPAAEPDQTRLAVFRRRILVAQAGYLLATGMCLIDAWVSVAALLVVQLYYVVSPHIGPLDALHTPRHV